jgi:UDP:flavonoid glycosyltransferase YjiC (YdhE family)
MRMLVASGPYPGHILPIARLVQGCVRAGHDVTWYTGKGYEGHVTPTGATLLPIEDDIVAMLPRYAKPLDEHITEFVAAAPGMRQQLAGRETDWDVVIADPPMIGVHRFAAAARRPLVTLGVIPGVFVDPGVNLHLQFCMPGMEYPRPDLPQMVCVGPMPPLAEPWSPPSWWTQLPQKPTIAIVQGTFDTDPTKLVYPAVEMLRDLPEVEGIIATAAVIEDPPPNVHHAPWIPYAPLLQRVRGFLTNGGYGGVMMAVASGVPIIVAGEMDDKPQVAELVEWAGVGFNLKTERPPPPLLREAVIRLSHTPRFTERAVELGRRALTMDAVGCSIALIERVVGTAALLRDSPGGIAA